MPVTDTAAWPQAPKSAAVSVAAANTTLTDSPDDTALLLTAGANGSRIGHLKALPRATVSGAMVGYLYHSIDSGTTKRLIKAVAIAADTVSTTDAPAEVDFGYTEDAPLYLSAGAELYAGISVALTDGVVFIASYQDY
ncbi:hypothetical protein [Thalassobaculum sp.]|uniref:hypothetical protein n=1 Tax=Thalassobaculum sp. TaxID=2022740 RepID=UPI0032EF2753